MENNSNDDLTGPFWPGQKPYSCGHYFPNVLRTWVRGGTVALNCKFCGNDVQPTSLRNVYTVADDIAIEDLEEIREAHFERLRKAPRSFLNQTP
jgi:hypothetical protein